MNERQEPAESERSLADALERMGGGEPREERIEGKVEVARVPFDELDEEHARPKERGE